VLRLTPAGSRRVAAWFAGSRVGDSAAARQLARRLLDAGIAHPDPSPGDGPSPRDVTVVIPVRDRHAELARCLRGLRDAALCLGEDAYQVIVVDDCSADAVAIDEIAAGLGARVIRRPVNGGPGAARNTGLAAADTEFVAFLDSDCVPRAGWLDGLLPHFADPAAGAVAPRIVPHKAGTGWLARYEGASSTLDLGPRPSIVRPGARVSYVPGAALVVRKAAAGDGFAAGMFVGEDVDFVWRLAAAGWRVRYEPAAAMGHDHRVRLRAWFSRRADYGTSAAALEQLHPGAVRPLYASWWTAGAWTALLAGRPVTAAALTGTAAALLARRLSRVTGEPWPLPLPLPGSSHEPLPLIRDASARHTSHSRHHCRSSVRFCSCFVAYVHAKLRQSGNPETGEVGNQEQTLRQLPQMSNNSKKQEWGAAWQLAIRLAGGGTLTAGRPLGSALSRTWWPLAIPAAAAVPKLRLPLAALMLAPPLLDWADRRPPLDPVRYVAARLLDDAAYSLGVWQGCVRRRTIRPLLPVLGAQHARGVRQICR
jgi:mycofactocin system glycosyltransferase